MRQKRINLRLTRHDAAELVMILHLSMDGEAGGMLLPEQRAVADRLLGRLWALLQPRKTLLEKETSTTISTGGHRGAKKDTDI